MGEFGNRVRAARAYAGLGQEGLARKVGVSTSTIQRLESEARGLKPYEERAMREAIAEACGLPVEFFTEDFAKLAGEEIEFEPSDSRPWNEVVRDLIESTDRLGKMLRGTTSEAEDASVDRPGEPPPGQDDRPTTRDRDVPQTGEAGKQRRRE